jgi:hypothetical protein
LIEYWNLNPSLKYDHSWEGDEVRRVGIVRMVSMGMS